LGTTGREEGGKRGGGVADDSDRDGDSRWPDFYWNRKRGGGRGKKWVEIAVRGLNTGVWRFPTRGGKKKRGGKRGEFLV